MGEICKRVQCNSLYGGCIECNFLLIHSCFFFPKKKDCLGISKKELHQLLDDKELNGIPILVLGNKSDISPHLNE